MEIVFRLTEADILALSDHNHQKSAVLRGTNRRVVFLAPVFFLLCGLLLWLATSDPVMPITLSILSIIWIAFMPRRLRQQRRQLMGRIYREGKNRALFQPQMMRAEHEALIVETVAGTSRVKWEYIERIDVTDERTFIYLNALSAHIVPKHGVVRGEYDYFVRDVDQHWRRAIASARRDEVPEYEAEWTR